MASSDVEGLSLPMDDYETLLSTTDVELLKRAWRNEKAAPDILRFETDLIGRIREQIQLMVFPNPTIFIWFFKTLNLEQKLSRFWVSIELCS